MPAAASFFDDYRYLRTVVAEKSHVRSRAEAHGATRLAVCDPGATILDAGCGNGRHAVPLARAGYRVFGLDASYVLLRAARAAARPGARPTFVRGSYLRLPFESSAFQAVVCLGTALGYLGEAGDRAALREFRRVLEPAGRLVIETLHGDELGVRLGEDEERPLASARTLRFERKFDKASSTLHEVQRLDADPPRAYDLRVYRESELCGMLESAGFEVVGRHASLTAEGEPSPATPLVLVAQR
jgi:SAM-dependent methyltransferase